MDTIRAAAKRHRDQQADLDFVALTDHASHKTRDLSDDDYFVGLAALLLRLDWRDPGPHHPLARRIARLVAAGPTVEDLAHNLARLRRRNVSRDGDFWTPGLLALRRCIRQTPKRRKSRPSGQPLKNEQTDAATRAIALMMDINKRTGKIAKANDLAKAVGCSRPTLYRSKQFTAARKAMRAAHAHHLPRGTKDL